MNVLAQRLERKITSETPLRSGATARPESVPAEWYNCAPRLIAQQARTTPSTLAVVDGKDALTYEELETRSSELAARLQMRGVSRDVVVGVCAERSIAFVVGALGVMKAGGAYLPLDPTDPKARLAFQVRDAGASIVVTADSSKSGFSIAPEQVFHSGENGTLLAPSHPGSISVDTNGDALAYVIYTSGSSGTPKGVEITHASLSNLISWHCEAFDVTTADRASFLSGVGFDAAVWELWPYLAAGATVCVAPNSVVREPEALRDWLLRHHITVSFTPTPLTECLMELEWPQETRLRTMLTGGDVLHSRPPATLPFQVVNNYGPTECTVVATSGVVIPADGQVCLPAIGRPVANTTVHILNDSGAPVRAGEPGVIWIGGKGLARGYRNQVELTAEKFLPDPFDPAPGARIYCTGDRGRLLADGQIAFLGRTDDQIKIRGFRIEPGEIETLLNQHPSVRESAVVAREHAPGDVRLAAFVVPKLPLVPAISEIREYLAERLPDYMIPSEFSRLSSLPLSPHGKIDRAALRLLDAGPMRFDREPGGRVLPPRDDLERQLEGIWEENLGVRPIGVNEDYFRLGGDSLGAARLFARLKQQFGVSLPISALLETRTIEGLARALRTQQSSNRCSSLVAIQPSGYRPPIVCVHPGQGDVFCFRDFPKHLGADQPFYALQSRALGGGAPHFSVSEMAGHYVDELRRVQPEGPYYLLGLSFGGLVAFEMAHKILAQHQEVGFLGMWYTPPPGYLDRYPFDRNSSVRERIASKLSEQRTLGTTEKLRHLVLNAYYLSRLVLRSAQIDSWRFIARSLGNSAVERLGRHLSDLHYFHVAAAKNYRPDRPFPGRITVFLPAGHPYESFASTGKGWDHFAQGGVELVNITAGEGLQAIPASIAEVSNSLRAAVESHEQRNYGSASNATDACSLGNRPATDQETTYS